MEQGIFRAEQGNISREQGISTLDQGKGASVSFHCDCVAAGTRFGPFYYALDPIQASMRRLVDRYPEELTVVLLGITICESALLGCRA